MSTLTETALNLYARLLPVALLAALVSLGVTASEVSAQEREPDSFAIGLGSGTLANGLSLEYQFEEAHALQLNFGSWGGGGADERFDDVAGGVAGSIDYLHLMPSLYEGRVMQIAWNLGAGVGLGVDDEPNELGVAGALVAGLEFNFKPIPLGLTLEYRPTVPIIPDVGLDLIDFTGHLRVRF